LDTTLRPVSGLGGLLPDRVSDDALRFWNRRADDMLETLERYYIDVPFVFIQGRRAKERLEAGLGAPAPVLAYPNGTPLDYDAGAVADARAAGHVGAVTTVPGWNPPGTPPFEVQRFVLDPVRGPDHLRMVARHPGALRFLAGW
jgi:hypothetical protein